MHKIKEIIIGTNNEGKYKEICDLLPNGLKKRSLTLSNLAGSLAAFHLWPKANPLSPSVLLKTVNLGLAKRK